MCTIVIVEDSPATAFGYRALFEEYTDAEVVGLAPDAETGIRLVKRNQPSIVLCDVSLPDLNGITAISEMISACRTLRPIVVSGRWNDWLMYSSFRAGARAFQTKCTTIHDMMQCVSHVMDGRFVMENHAMDAAGLAEIMESYRELYGIIPITEKEVGCPFTPRECAVLQALSSGASNQQIAATLNLSARTITNHIAHMLKKTSATNRTQLVLWAHGLGLVQNTVQLRS